MKKSVLKKVALLLLMVVVVSTFSGCFASCQRSFKTWNSNVSGGLNRTVTVYSYDGDVIKTYSGKIDISDSSDSEVLFDLNGKRIIIDNAIVITEEN